MVHNALFPIKNFISSLFSASPGSLSPDFATKFHSLRKLRCFLIFPSASLTSFSVFLSCVPLFRCGFYYFF